MSQQHQLEVFLGHDRADILVSGFTRDKLEEVSVTIVLILVLQHLFDVLLSFCVFLVLLQRMHLLHFEIAVVELVALLGLRSFSMHTLISNADAPPPKHVLVVAVQLLRQIVHLKRTSLLIV